MPSPTVLRPVQDPDSLSFALAVSCCLGDLVFLFRTLSVRFTIPPGKLPIQDAPNYFLPHCVRGSLGKDPALLADSGRLDPVIRGSELLLFPLRDSS